MTQEPLSDKEIAALRKLAAHAETLDRVAVEDERSRWFWTTARRWGAWGFGILVAVLAAKDFLVDVVGRFTK